MTNELLIDAIVRQTTVLIAQLATANGVRTPIADLAEQVFAELVRELERQGVSRKVAADMFGMALRTFRRRVQRLSESRTIADRSLWEAVHAYIGEHDVVLQSEVLRRFHRDDEELVRGVLNDPGETGPRRPVLRSERHRNGGRGRIMRRASLTIAVYLCAALAGVVAPACSSSSGAGSETHFVCAGDSDCNAGLVCVESRCIESPVSTGDGGSGGRGPAETPTKDSGVVTPVVDSGRRDAGSPPSQVACPADPSVGPLDDGCTDAVCHAVLRLDYLTLAPKGWATVGGPLHAVDESTAKATAASVFASDCMYCSGVDSTVQSASAGLYRVFKSPSDFGAFALVGAQSGLVVAAGGVTWAGRGSYYVPTAWKSASDIRCGTGTAVAKETYIDALGGCETGDTMTGASGPQALALALRTNIARGYAQKGSFSAYTYLYTPTVGACNPAVAEYVVVLSR